MLNKVAHFDEFVHIYHFSCWRRLSENNWIFSEFQVIETFFPSKWNYNTAIVLQCIHQMSVKWSKTNNIRMFKSSSFFISFKKIYTEKSHFQSRIVCCSIWDISRGDNHSWPRKAYPNALIEWLACSYSYSVKILWNGLSI